MKSSNIIKLLVWLLSTTYICTDSTAKNKRDNSRNSQQQMQTSSEYMSRNDNSTNKKYRNKMKTTQAVIDSDEETYNDNDIDANINQDTPKKRKKHKRNNTQASQNDMIDNQDEISNSNEYTPINNKPKNKKKQKNTKDQDTDATTEDIERLNNAVQTVKDGLSKFDKDTQDTINAKINQAIKTEITQDKSPYVNALYALYVELEEDVFEAFISAACKTRKARRDLNNLLPSLKSKDSNMWKIINKHVNQPRRQTVEES